MRPLPAEILTEILLYLDQHDKMECMLVCNYWKQVIKQSALYHTICIYSEDALDKFTRIIQENVDIESKIEQLVLFNDGYFDADKLEKLLLPLFNLKKFIFYDNGYFDSVYDKKKTNKETPYQFYRHIQYMSEQSGCALTQQLLLSGVCCKLTTLEINRLEKDWIPCLKNAPALKDLNINGASFALSDLELLHENLACLESLKLYYFTLLDSTLDHHVKPAMTMTECAFDLLSLDDSRLYTTLLAYIHTKYPNTTKLIYNFQIGNITDATIENGIVLTWDALFTVMGHQLKTLCVDNGGYITHFFETLDAYGCQLEHLRISSLSQLDFSKLTQSKQALSIRKLELANMNFGLFTWLKELKKLEELSLLWSVLRIPVRLNSIIANAPSTLHSLYFEYMNIEIDLNCTSFSNIETLSFSFVDLPEKADVFISQHFPKLRHLELFSCFQPGSTFDLTPVDLLSFRYAVAWHNYDVAILVVTHGENEQRFYSLKHWAYSVKPINYFTPFHHTIFPQSKFWVVKKTDNEPYFTFICNSVKNLEVVQ